MAGQIFILGVTVICSFSILLPEASALRIVNVEAGGRCALGSAPIGPYGAWQVVEKDVKKICAAGTSCRQGACNCDNLSDGTLMSLSWDYDREERTCKRIAGQKCSSSDQCFYGVQCQSGICTCPTNDADFRCVDTKYDMAILA